MYMEPIDARGLCPLLSARPIISSSAVLGPCDAIKKDMEAHVIHAPGVQFLVGLGDRGCSWLLATFPPSPQPSRPSARLVCIGAPNRRFLQLLNNFFNDGQRGCDANSEKLHVVFANRTRSSLSFQTYTKCMLLQDYPTHERGCRTAQVAFEESSARDDHDASKHTPAQ